MKKKKPLFVLPDWSRVKSNRKQYRLRLNRSIVILITFAMIQSFRAPLNHRAPRFSFLFESSRFSEKSNIQMLKCIGCPVFEIRFICSAPENNLNISYPNSEWSRKKGIFILKFITGNGLIQSALMQQRIKWISLHTLECCWFVLINHLPYGWKLE